MTAPLAPEARMVIDITRWSAILFADRDKHDAAGRRFDAMILRRLREELSND